MSGVLKIPSNRASGTPCRLAENDASRTEKVKSARHQPAVDIVGLADAGEAPNNAIAMSAYRRRPSSAAKVSSQPGFRAVRSGSGVHVRDIESRRSTQSSRTHRRYPTLTAYSNAPVLP